MHDNLIATLLRAALEDTGVQRGLVILSRNGESRITAEATRSGEKIVVRVRGEVAAESLLTESVISFVRQTRESVLIDNAANAPARFAATAYFRQHKAGSILCLPLLNQANFVGALLLEHHFSSGTFTPARIAALQHIASLAASALENSRLRVELQERETNIRRLIDANVMGVYTVDIHGPILESNDAYLRMLGYKQADVASGCMNWNQLTPPEWHSADAQRVETVKKVGRLQPFEKEFFRKDGSRVPVLLGVARFKEPRNQAVVFALDMSGQKRKQAEAVEMRLSQQIIAARKSHDALLQNFQGMLYRFQGVRNLMPRDPNEAMRSLNDAIREGELALDKSRNAIQEFRPGSEGDLS